MLSKRNMKARLKFVRENVDKDQDIWNNVLWTDESKIELFGHQSRGHVWCKSNTAFQENVCHGLLQQDLVSSPS